MNDPVIESSSNLTFAPFNVAYHGLQGQMEKAGLKPDENRWELLYDFTPKESGLNYEVMDPSNFKLMTLTAPGHEDN